MPLEGDSNFDGLKKAYANGVELRGKTLGIIGFGRIGQAVCKMALGLGMKVIAADKFVSDAVIRVDFIMVSLLMLISKQNHLKTFSNILTSLHYMFLLKMVM